MKITTLSHDDWSKEFAVILINAIASVLEKKKNCSILLTGGRTASAVYNSLSINSHFLGFRNLNFYLSDERCVNSNSKESNYLMIMKNLFPYGLGVENIFSKMYDESAGINNSLRRYSLEVPQNIDIGLLSVGDDGHIASIFSGDQALQESRDRFAIGQSPSHQSRRITITPHFLRDIKKIYVLAIGEEKRRILTRVIKSPLDQLALPAKLLINCEWVVA